jgi:hypothetical protein
MLRYALALLVTLAVGPAVAQSPAPAPAVTPVVTFPADRSVPLRLTEGHVAELLGWQMVPEGVGFAGVKPGGHPDHVLILLTHGDERAVVVHPFAGSRTDPLGEAVFYAIFDGAGRLLRWAGNPYWHLPGTPA